MKKVYTDNPVIAEQFTDQCMPEGVMAAPDEFIEKVLVGSLRYEAKEKGAYIFKYPKPSDCNKEVAELFGVPFSFDWIKKGDYVLTYPSGYARVEAKESFDRDYQEIEIL